MDPITEFTVPDGWQRTYRALAAKTPSAGGITDLAEALHLAKQLVDPALASAPVQPGTAWIPGTGWTDNPETRPVPGENEPPNDVHVRNYVRGGFPVSDHWRSRRGSGPGSST